MPDPRIPDIPGQRVPRENAAFLQSEVANFCRLQHTRFPGSQPVSFTQKDLDRLEKEDYWVCEKSDGIRVLVFIHTNLATNEQCTYLIDRHNDYRLQSGFYFPHHENPAMPLRSTILDGELVLDIDPRSKQETVRLLVFDCLIIDGENVMLRPLDKRYGRVQAFFYKPYSKMVKDHPHVLQGQPFEIKVKNMECSYGIEKVFKEDIPRLMHGNDGLIYTCAQSPYVVGTDPKMYVFRRAVALGVTNGQEVALMTLRSLKWKPPSENSIDFKLVLRFPPDPRRPNEADMYAKPIFGLHIFTGHGDKYEPFDEMHVEDDEWETLKNSGEQIDDRIVEVHWEPATSRWRMMRFRDDKPHGNFQAVVYNIISSIADGVERDDLLARSGAIRTAWKARERQAQPTQQPGPSRTQPQPPPPPRPVPKVELRYGPLQKSTYSKVGGPAVVCGFYR